MAASFTLGTLNANGIRDNKTRLSMFSWIKSIKNNVTFLQETHCHTPSERTDWTGEWGDPGDSLWSLGTNHSRGVAILFNFDCDFSYENEAIDVNGRYIYLELLLGGNRYKLINIYAPNDPKQRINFFGKNNMYKWVNESENNFIGGDYNCTQDTHLDRLNCLSNNDEGRPDLKKLMYDKNLEDVWRRRNPGIKKYSWSRGEKRSRLDYWLVSKSLDSSIINIDFIPCVYSDHDMIVLKAQYSDTERGPGTWKMNSSVIQSDLFKRCFIDLWSSWREKKSNFSDLGLWWDLGKNKIKELTIWVSTKLKQDEQKTQIWLENEIKRIKSVPNYDQVYLYDLELRLRSFLDRRAEGQRIRSRVKWFEEGEQSTKFFHSIEKTKSSNKDFEQIFDENKVLKSGTDDVMKVQVDFYKKLFTSEGIDDSACDYFGKYITKVLSDEDKNLMNAPININELQNALKKMKNEKSPGPDGIIPLFYKLYWEYIKDDLYEVFEFSYGAEELSYSQYLALIILLYKKGIREDIRNWRPISLSNCDIKILTKAFAERLRVVLPHIIDVDQTGCVKGRKIGHSIRLINDVFDELDSEGCILSTDKEKAFDRVEWRWLFYVLKKYGFGNYFINWILIMYKGMKSAIVTNGYISAYFNLSRGIRQGDSLSALLYIIQAEPLAEYFRRSNEAKGIEILDQNNVTHELKGCTYVDDAINFIKNVDYIPYFLNKIDLFGLASGSRINKSKTIALVSEHFQDNQSNACPGVDFIGGVDKVLGVPVGKGPIIQSFWSQKFAKMKKKLDFWKIRDLSLIGRVYISKSLILPLVQYASTHICISENMVQQIQDLIWNFVWKWGTCVFSKRICYLPRNEGGLGLPDFNLLVKASRIKMLIEVMKNKSKWNVIARKYLCFLDNEYDIENFALIASDCKLLIKNSNIPKFYKECLLAFHDFNSAALIPFKNPVLWLNDQIRFKRKSLSLKEWSKSGVKYLSDIVLDGSIDQQLTLNKIRNHPDLIFDFSKLRTAINSSNIDVRGINQDSGVPGFEKLMYVIDSDKEPKCVFDLSSKDIYSVLLRNTPVVKKSEKYWSDKLGETNLPFDMWYNNLMMSKVIPRKALDFNFRIFHGQVLTEKYLVKFGYSKGTCLICRLHIEDLGHMLTDCDFVRPVWRYIDNLFVSLGFPLPSHIQKIVGFIERADIFDLRNVIMSIVRWQIWKRRCSIRYKKDYNSSIPITVQVRYSLKYHFDVLIRSTKYKKRIDLNLVKKCLNFLQ